MTLGGIYKGIVVNNIDDQSRNRLQIRVPQLHGDGSVRGYSDDTLPWALPALPFTSDPPLPIGAVVWVMFEAMDSRFPVYLGYLVKYAEV